jgi:hypothetical protein
MLVEAFRPMRNGTPRPDHRCHGWWTAYIRQCHCGKRGQGEKGIVSELVGNADIILVPDLVSGNILAKTLEYLADAALAGIVFGLAVPVILTSRADQVPARLASIALPVLLHKGASPVPMPRADPESTNHVVAQSEAACCPCLHDTGRGRRLAVQIVDRNRNGESKTRLSCLIPQQCHS